MHAIFVETKHGWTSRLRAGGFRGGHGLRIQRSESRCGSPLVLRHNDSDARNCSIEEFDDDHHADFQRCLITIALPIMDFEQSLNYDIKLLRSSPAVPKHVKLYGFFYEMSGALTEVVRDIPA